MEKYEDVEVMEKELPEISKDDLLAIERSILSMPLIENELLELEISGVEINLIMTDQLDDQGRQNGLPVEYYRPEDRWDIYMWKNLPENVKKIALFHEIIEIKYRILGHEGEDAHFLAMIHEKKFGRFFHDDDLEYAVKLREKYPRAA